MLQMSRTCARPARRAGIQMPSRLSWWRFPSISNGGGGEIKLIVSSGELLHSHYFFETVRTYTTEDTVV
jgi:hypothetical protein